MEGMYIEDGRLAAFGVSTARLLRPSGQEKTLAQIVDRYLQERLPAVNRTLYAQVKEVLDENKAQRHIRGGIATRKKYKGV